MNKLFIFLILGCSTLLSANQYHSQYDRSCSSCNDGYYDGYYRDNGYRNNGYRDNGYYYGDDGYYRDNGNYREGGYHYRNRDRYDNKNNQDQQRHQDKESNFSKQRNERYYQADNDQDMRDDSNSSSSDQEISKQIEKTLSSGWFSKGYQDVTFDVNNGNVTLNGTVDSQSDKIKAEDAVKKIDGVKSVTNQINAKNK